MQRKVRPSRVLNVIFTVGVLALAWGAWSSYQAWTSMPSGVDEKRTDPVSTMLAQELRAMFTDVTPDQLQYGIVTERNLFSPERRPWTPPPPTSEDASLGDNQIQAFPQGAVGIRLYGTSIGPARRSALLYFERFSSSQKHMILEEGETARDEGERGETLYFVLKSLNQDTVILEDAQGREHTIGLYDHARTEPQPMPGPRQGAGMRGPAPAPALTFPEGSEPIRRMEDIPESQEERERLAREGRLRRISTPSGPVFQPVE